MFTFTWYQSKQYEKQRIYQASLDSIARAEAILRGDTLPDEKTAAYDTLGKPVDKEVNRQEAGIYKDSLLEVARKKNEDYFTLANNKLEIVFSTKGAQPYSVKIKDFKNYDSTALYPCCTDSDRGPVYPSC